MEDLLKQNQGAIRDLVDIADLEDPSANCTWKFLNKWVDHTDDFSSHG